MKVISLLFGIMLLMFAGCSQLDLGNVNISEMSEEDINKIIVCNPPYIRYGLECCLDQNNNSICDKDEPLNPQERVESQSNSGSLITVERIEMDGVYLKNTGSSSINATVTSGACSGNKVVSANQVDKVLFTDACTLESGAVGEAVVVTANGVFSGQGIVR